MKKYFLFFKNSISEYLVYRAMVEKYAKDKILKITFNNPVSEDDIKKISDNYRFSPMEVKFKLPREKVKEQAQKILSSDLPVDDIMIDEIEVESIIRNIFEKANGK